MIYDDLMRILTCVTSYSSRLLSKENSKDGSKTKFENIATIKVVEVSAPKAIVPPNSEAVKMIKPANKTNDV
jgi:hypothetical protein